MNAFRRPLSLDAVERSIARKAYSAAGGQLPKIVELISQVLDLPQPRKAAQRVRKPEQSSTTQPADDQVRYDPQSLANAHESLGEKARCLVRTLHGDVYIFGADNPRQLISVINRSPDIVDQHVAALTMPIRRIDRMQGRLRDGFRGASPVSVPDELSDAIDGNVLSIGRNSEGWHVVGGSGANTYDMSMIAGVYDVGGNDTYQFPGPPPGAVQSIIDQKGDDTYVSDTDFAGPAAGVFGLSVLIDRDGDDVYRTSRLCSIGAGLFGMGILIDRAGNDRYDNTGKHAGWSIGAGFYGAGVIVDQAGEDSYHGEILCQGVGGPRGFGAIIDTKGRDTYKANGPHFKSVYGTKGVYVSMSQGFGIGIRGYASGGVGALYDLSGDDAYEGGEFAQAGGYFFGLGIMHDVRVNDEYNGNRYGQAFAAHQAAGILVDDEGDDVYRSMTAASQAGTWDQSVGMLIDHAGNDRYICDSLGQGAAAMQALAVLLDLAGEDMYQASGSRVQGHAGSNTYHYDADNVFSFAALLDLGGGNDEYSANRSNNARKATGSYNKQKPARTQWYGMFVDWQ